MALQPTLEPILTNDELNLLLDSAAIEDYYGNLPLLESGSVNPNWTPTYDLESAIVAGWRTKAAKAAGGYLFLDNGLSLHREQVIANCLKMADEASKSCIGYMDADNELIKRRVIETQVAQRDY